MSDAVEYTRHQDYLSLDAARAATVAVLGCGGIGSPVALMLARLGIGTLYLVDSDTVEAHNVPSQCYTVADIGESKVLALAAHCRGVGAPIVHTVGAFAPSALAGDALCGADVIVSGVDTMAARGRIWRYLRRRNAVHATHYIDARVGGEHVVVYGVAMSSRASRREYESSLYSDDSALSLPCTGRAVVDVGHVAAALAVREIRHALVGRSVQTMTHVDWRALCATSWSVER